MARKSVFFKRPLMVLGIVVVGWLVIPTIIKTFVRQSILELQAPSQHAASLVRDVQDYWALRTDRRTELLQELSELARMNNYYELQRQQVVMLREELERLEAILDLNPPPAFRYEIARVARRDTGSWWQHLTIRKGRNHGIPEGAPVVFAGGVVGRVKEVHLTTSTVELLSSNSLRLSARLEHDSRPLGYQGGDNRPFATPRGRLQFVPLDLRLEEDETPLVVTSGLGGVFPEGLVIGRLVRVEPGRDTLFQTGEVVLDDRLTQLREVAILIPLREED